MTTPTAAIWRLHGGGGRARTGPGELAARDRLTADALRSALPQDVRAALPEEQRPVLLVAATGGHLAQLHKLAQMMLAPGTPREWVTFDTPQSRTLLRGERVHYVPYIAPRDWRTALAVAPIARRVITQVQPRMVVSTGSAVAVPFMAAARLRGVACRYIESAARSQSPSLSGRIVSRFPGVECSTQYATWADAKWHATASVFDAYAAVAQPAPPVRRLVVALGTIEGYSFERLVRRLMEIVPADVEVLWQLGPSTPACGLRDTRGLMSRDELRQAMEAADAVITHAGVGSALDALDCGQWPILVPRAAVHNEHVDDHQLQIAHELAGRGLAATRDASQITWADVCAAATKRVVAAAAVVTVPAQRRAPLEAALA